MKYWGQLNINRLLLFVFVRQFFFNYKTVHNIYSHLIHPERIAADQQDNLITGTTAPPINIISLWNNGTPKGPKNLSRLLCSPHFVTRLAKAIDLWHVFFRALCAKRQVYETESMTGLLWICNTTSIHLHQLHRQVIILTIHVMKKSKNQLCLIL